jgi:hypothetical protein
MVGASVAMIVAWDRDREALRRLRYWPGWALAGIVASTWPVLTALRHPSVLGLWTLHVTDRLASRPEHFAGGPWWQYGPALLVQALPWTPLALLGAGPVAGPRPRRPGPGRGRSSALGLGGRAGGALIDGDGQERPLRDPRAPPLVDLGRPGPDAPRRSAAQSRAGRPIGSVGARGSASRASAWPSAWDSPPSAPWFDRRGVEWASTRTPRASCGRANRSPCSTTTGTVTRIRRPFGPVPHDLAVRLYYLDRPACWRSASSRSPTAAGAAREAFAVIGRDRDLPGLRRLGRVETVPTAATRFDRTYALFRSRRANGIWSPSPGSEEIAGGTPDRPAESQHRFVKPGAPDCPVNHEKLAMSPLFGSLFGWHFHSAFSLVMWELVSPSGPYPPDEIGATRGRQSSVRSDQSRSVPADTLPEGEQEPGRRNDVRDHDWRNAYKVRLMCSSSSRSNDTRRRDNHGGRHGRSVDDVCESKSRRSCDRDGGAQQATKPAGARSDEAK